MKHNGLAKLAEECGELLQVTGKLLQYPELQYSREAHPDGKIPLDNIEDEIGDVLAAIEFVSIQLKLNHQKMNNRAIQKIALFEQWMNEV